MGTSNLHSPSAISISDIVNEFGGSGSASLSEYYAGGAYVPSGASGDNGTIPSSGAIKLSDFYGASAGPTIQVPGGTVDDNFNKITESYSEATLLIDRVGNIWGLKFNTGSTTNGWPNVQQVFQQSWATNIPASRTSDIGDDYGCYVTVTSQTTDMYTNIYGTFDTWVHMGPIAYNQWQFMENEGSTPTTGNGAGSMTINVKIAKWSDVSGAGSSIPGGSVIAQGNYTLAANTVNNF